MSCQTAPATCDGDVQAVPPSFSEAVQVRRRPTVGPELPAAGFCFDDLLRGIRENPGHSPAEVMIELTRDQQVTYRQRQVLVGLLTAAIVAERGLARHLLRRLQECPAAGPDRPEVLRQALAELEAVADRFVPEDDLFAVAPADALEDA